MSAIKAFFTKIIALILALFGISYAPDADAVKNYSFNIDTSVYVSDELSNPASNITTWSIYKTGPFVNVKANEENNVFDFVEYVQLMQCTGGNYARDLFKDPYDSTVLDDYDFTALIENCRGIVSLGAKPVLKLGSVPMKYTKNAKLGALNTNVYPPDDYNVYYNYIKAIAEELVKQFGLDEVLTWRFMVMTEYENSDWFISQSRKRTDTAKEYFKLYDYTVQALIDTLGEDICVGAHSMTVTEGYWDEVLFIKHCASGTNYATGKTGSKLSFLTASFYDTKPGKYTSGKTLQESIDYLRTAAQDAGLYDLFYGIDESRILRGNSSGTDSSALPSRTCGYTYQAAYDARCYKTMFENDIDYLCAWTYLSGGLFEGNPTVSYHTARLASKFAGSKLVATAAKSSGSVYNAEVETVAAYNSDTNTLRVMAYNFKNDVDYDTEIDLSLNINAYQFAGKNVKITKYVVDDDCNFFDEWTNDRKTYGIGNDCFYWSPDDPTIDTTSVLNDQNAIKLYKEKLYDKYTECSKLIPSSQTVSCDGKLTLDTSLSGNAVVFYEIELA